MKVMVEDEVNESSIYQTKTKPKDELNSLNTRHNSWKWRVSEKIFFFIDKPIGRYLDTISI